MAVVIKYTKAQYQAKIDELEAYYSELARHLTNLENLKSQMFDFWNDENARKAADSLVNTIVNVKGEMNYTREMIIMYKNIVAKLDSTNASMSDLLEEASSILNLLG